MDNKRVEPGSARLAGVGLRGEWLQGEAHAAAHSHLARLSAPGGGGGGARMNWRSPSFVFRGPVVRRLSAEQFTDAVSRTRVAALHQAGLCSRAHDDSQTLGLKGASGSGTMRAQQGRASFPEGVRYFRKTVDAADENESDRRAGRRHGGQCLHTLRKRSQGRLRRSDWNNAESADVTASVAPASP